MNRLLAALTCALLALPARAADDPPMKLQAANGDDCDDLKALRVAEASDPDSIERIDAALLACRLKADLNVDMARRALGSARSTLSVQGDVISFFARVKANAISAGGSIEAPMDRIDGTDIWVARFRLALINRAMVNYFPHDESWQPLPGVRGIEWRGPDAPPLPERKEKLNGTMQYRKLWSDALQETRKLIIYLPPGYREGENYPALYMGDGGFGWEHYVEPLIDRHIIQPIVLIGAAAGKDGTVEDRSSLGVELRAADYLPGFENAGDRFDRHMRFFAEELVPYAEREFSLAHDRAKRAIQGQSNSAVFAGWAGIEHPELFGTVMAYSAGWKHIDRFGSAGGPRARFLLSAGLYEAGFYVSTKRTAKALRAHSFDVSEEFPVAGHDPNAWAMMLTKHLPLVFGR